MPKRIVSFLLNKYTLSIISLAALVIIPSFIAPVAAIAPPDTHVAQPLTRISMHEPSIVSTPVLIPDQPGQPVLPTPPSPTSPPPIGNGGLLFGLGAELDAAMTERLTVEAPVKMLTSWYNGPNDLGFMHGWKDSKIADAYAKGYALHLVVYNNDAEQNISTAYGPACGRPYPLSSKFLDDMKDLAATFNGKGTLYVSMFTELQTYPCKDNTWAGSENYYRTLKDQYRAAQSIFRQYAPNSKMSLSWGGWQANYDDPGNGGGISLITKFADVLSTSDFQSFQAMGTQSDNKAIMLRMTQVLHQYGPVMVSHFKPDNASQTAFDADVKAIFTADTVKQLQDNGLFALSFMDASLLKQESSYQAVKQAVTTFGR